MSLKFPKPLKPGDTIGIISPGGAVSDHRLLEKGKAFLETRGYRVFMHPHNYLQTGKWAGLDHERAAALTEMFANPSVDAIMCARGGAGALRLLDKIDYRLIKKTPKIFIGYSDITVLLQAITQKCAFATYHGPMLASFGRDADVRSAHDFFALLGSRRSRFRLSVPTAVPVVAGEAEGVLVGGSLPLLQALIGTPYDWTSKNAILFIEDCNEHMYRFDRMMNHLRLAGKFKNVRGVIVGEMINLWNNEADGEPPYRDFKQILHDHLPPSIPLCTDFPCGHGKYITTFPVGGRVQLTVGMKDVELSFIRS